MDQDLTIGEVAHAAGVPISTVRYYERAGLLTARRRSTANYRLYGQAEIERIRFIKAAQATGFTLGDVAQLLRPAPCGRVQELIEGRVGEVDTRMKELRHVKRILSAALVECRRHEASGRCKVIDNLTTSVRSKRPR